MKTRFRVFIACAAVGALGLAAMGIWMQFSGVARSFEGHSESAIALIVVGMILCAAAVFLPLSAARKAGLGSRLAHRKEQYPHQPWKWVEEWDQGKVVSGRSFPWNPLLIALLWNALLCAVWLGAYAQWEAATSALKWTALAAPVVGVWLVVAASRAVARWRLFRESTLELDTCPVPIGGELKGAIETQIPAQGSTIESFRVAFTCLREVIPTVRHVHMRREAVVWRSVSTFRPCISKTDNAKLAIPIGFALPGDVPSTTPGLTNDRIVWSVDVQSEPSRFVDYKSLFDVPVFNYPFVVDTTNTARYKVDRVPVSSQDETPMPGVSVLRDGANLSIVFQRARERRLALALLVFAIVWLGLTAVIFLEGAPIALTAMLVAFAGVPLWRSIALMLVETELRVAQGQVEIIRRIGTHERSTVLPKKLVQEVQLASTKAVGEHRQFSLTFRTSEGKLVPLVERLPDQKVAEWIGFQINAAIGKLRRVRFNPSAIRVDAAPLTRDRRAVPRWSQPRVSS